MIQYRTGTWGLAFVFSSRGSVFPKAVAFAVPCAIMCMGFRVLLNQEEQLGGQMLGAGDVGSTVLSNFTFILGFLTVFRSQQAYSRWWEGGRLLMKLRGEWFNAFSSCIAFCDYTPAKREKVKVFEHELVRLVSLLYATALNSLNESDNDVYELVDLYGMDTDSLEFLKDSFNPTDVVLQWIQRLIVQANCDGLIIVAPPILSRVVNQLGNGMTILQAARQLNDFPIPFPLAQIITVLMLFHWLMTAIVVATSVQSIVWSGIISFVVIFSFWGVHYIGEELEQPFGSDVNDLPIHEMQRDMNSSLREILDSHARHPPDFRYDSDTHNIMPLRDAELGAYVNELIAREKDSPESPSRGAGRKKTSNVVSNEAARRLGTALSSEGLGVANQTPVTLQVMGTITSAVPTEEDEEEEEEDEKENNPKEVAVSQQAPFRVGAPLQRVYEAKATGCLRDMRKETSAPDIKEEAQSPTALEWSPSHYTAAGGKCESPELPISGLSTQVSGHEEEGGAGFESYYHFPANEAQRLTPPGARGDTSRL